MLKAIIIDDEAHAIQSLEGLLVLYCPAVKVVGQAGSVSEGMAAVRQLRPELVFLDVNLGEETGFDLLEQMKETDFHLIFTTAHSEYAIKAFRHNAIDYLLKPIEPVLLKEAVDKVAQKDSPRLDTRQLENLIQSLSGRQPEKITIASAEGYHFIEVLQVIRIVGDGNYSTFYLQGGEQVVASKNLKTYEELLPTDQFIKVHQSHIVNLRYVKKLLFQDGSFLLLEDNSQVPLARRRREAVMAALRLR